MVLITNSSATIKFAMGLAENPLNRCRRFHAFCSELRRRRIVKVSTAATGRNVEFSVTPRPHRNTYLPKKIANAARSLNLMCAGQAGVFTNGCVRLSLWLERITSSPYNRKNARLK
jgi:hypothetical protein